MASNRVWIAAGGILGVIFGTMVAIEQVSPLFPQLGGLEKIIRVIATGWFGVLITNQCKPSRRALMGAVISPILLIAYLLFTIRANTISLASIIGWVAFGTLAGILIGTAWLGALVGTLIMAFVIIIVAPIVRGAIGGGWIFIPMGSVAGALWQLAFSSITEKQPLRTERGVPEWLQTAALEKENKASDQQE